jgi:hypothetical protein
MARGHKSHIPISRNRVFDASLVPETCLDGFGDLKRLVKQVSEEAVYWYFLSLRPCGQNVIFAYEQSVLS